MKRHKKQLLVFLTLYFILIGTIIGSAIWLHYTIQHQPKESIDYSIVYTSDDMVRVKSYLNNKTILGKEKDIYYLLRAGKYEN